MSSFVLLLRRHNSKKPENAARSSAHYSIFRFLFQMNQRSSGVIKSLCGTLVPHSLQSWYSSWVQRLLKFPSSVWTFVPVTPSVMMNALCLFHNNIPLMSFPLFLPHCPFCPDWEPAGTVKGQGQTAGRIEGKGPGPSDWLQQHRHGSGHTGRGFIRKGRGNGEKHHKHRLKKATRRNSKSGEAENHVVCKDTGGSGSERDVLLVAGLLEGVKKKKWHFRKCETLRPLTGNFCSFRHAGLSGS